MLQSRIFNIANMPFNVIHEKKILVKIIVMANVPKLRKFFSFYSQIKCWLSGQEFTKCLPEEQSGKTKIRLLLQKQSDLGLPCLSRPFRQATSIGNYS